jgi:hypothetical protein
MLKQDDASASAPLGFGELFSLKEYSVIGGRSARQGMRDLDSNFGGLLYTAITRRL